MEVIQSYTITTLLLALRARLGGWEKRRLLSLPLMLLLWNRLGVIVREIERLAARFAAGLPMRLAPQVAVVGIATVAAETRTGPATPRIWPFRFCWLIRACGFEAAAFMGGLEFVLAQPEMKALLIACPQARRLLRPICRALAVETALLNPLAPGEVAVVKVRKTPVRRPREVIVHLRPLQPYVVAAVRAWKKRERG